MTEPGGTLVRILREITELLGALGDDVRDEEHALALLSSLGLAVPAAPASLLAVGTAVGNVRAAAEAYDAAAAASGENSVEAVGQLIALSRVAAETFTTLLGLGAALEADFAAYPGLLAEVNLGLLAQRLVEWAMITYLRRRAAPVYNTLALLGVVDSQVEVNEGDFARPHVRTQLRWERLKTAAQDPAALLADVYGWGTGLFDHRELLRRLHYVLQSLGAPVDAYPAGTEDTPSVELRLPLFAATGEGEAVELGLAFGRLEPTGTGTDAGLVLQPYAHGSVGAEVEPLPGWTLGMSGAFEGAGLGVGLRPPLTVELVGDVGGSARLVVTSEWRQAEGEPIVLVSQPDWFAIQVGGFRAELRAGIGDGGVARLGIQLEVIGGELTITPGEGDGFLRHVVPPDGLRVAFDLGFAWSDEHGLRLVGSGGVEVTLPVQLSVGGILDVQAVHLALSAGADGGTAAAAATFAVKLGPLGATVERMGFAAVLASAPDGGNIGTFDLATRFQPPTGIGFALDTGAVSGGGFVSIDEANHQYVGILYLDVGGVITVTAIGILTTRMPDGSDGFSLLILITAEFPPIQLGYGFALTGLGGLVGVNRTFDVEVLRAGVRTGALGAILFPTDPVANAAQLIATLKSVFPPAAGRFVFGPMIKIGWGPTSLLSAELGLILELPAPLRLVVVGKIMVVLPDPQIAVIALRLDVLGVLDLAKGEVSIDASLIDSRIAVFPVTGDMALRVGWGATKSFALAVGGFHPRFTPPPGFPSLARLAIALTSGDNPLVRVEAYFAVTANSIQFGGRMDLDVREGDFGARAFASLDALVQLQPFHFVFTLGMGIDITWKCDPLLHAHLDAKLEGPNPWHVHGRVEFEVLFLSGSIGVDVTIGSTVEDEPERIDLGTLLRTALLADDAWSGELPAGGGTGVSLRSSDPAAGLVVHPLGRFSVRQRALPLELPITRYGAGRPAEGTPTTFAVTSMSVGGTASPGTPLTDDFAVGQFVDLSDDEKLARPGFEAMPSGATSGMPRHRWPLDAGGAAVQDTLEIAYDEAVVNADEPLAHQRRGVRLDAALGACIARDGLAGHSAARVAALATPDKKVVVVGERFVAGPPDTVPGVAGATSFAQAAAGRQPGERLVSVGEVR